MSLWLFPKAFVIGSDPIITSKEGVFSPLSLEPYTFYNYQFLCYEANTGFYLLGNAHVKKNSGFFYLFLPVAFHISPSGHLHTGNAFVVVGLYFILYIVTLYNFFLFAILIIFQIPSRKFLQKKGPPHFEVGKLKYPVFPTNSMSFSKILKKKKLTKKKKQTKKNYTVNYF